MSQNSHTLLLFFDDRPRLEAFRSLFQALVDGESERGVQMSSQLNFDIGDEWSEHWFNHSVAPKAHYLRLHYETSTSYKLPLETLRRLFQAGMRAAVLEVFYDQVGEYERHHFLDGQLVNAATVLTVGPVVRQAIESDLREVAGDESSGVVVNKPCPIDKLIAQQADTEQETREQVESLLTHLRLSREAGVNPIEAMKDALLLRALATGVLQAIGFTVVTVLLFKGMWLWLGLGLVLLVALPLFHVSRVNKDFDPSEEVANAD